MEPNKLSEWQKEILQEVGNIGAGNAATSLSVLLNERIDMQIPSVQVVPFEDVVDLVGGPEQPMVAILFQIQGDTAGMVYFLLTREEANYLIHKLFPDAEGEVDFQTVPNDMLLSVLQEAGNIIVGSYLTALSDFINIHIHPSVPHVLMDMAGAILSIGLMELSPYTDDAIIIDTKMNDVGEANKMSGQILLLPTPDSFKKIFQALGVSDHD